MSSPEESNSYLGGGSPHNQGISRSGSIGGHRSRLHLTSDISIDEGDVLKKISEEAEEKLLHEKRKTDEARSYWHQKRLEQANYSDEETEVSGSPDGLTATSTPLGRSTTPISRRLLDDTGEYSPNLSRGSRGSSRPSSAMGQNDEAAELSKQWQDKYNELESKFKDALVSQAKLYDEKTTLVYQVESLKDQLEDVNQTLYELKTNSQRQHSQLIHAKHTEDTLHSDIDRLKNQVRYRDDFMEQHGLRLPTLYEEDEEEEEQTAAATIQFFPIEERDKLLQQITDLKNELEETKTNMVVAPSSDSLLRGEETKDIVRESTRLVSEYKNKLQLSEAETSRLDGAVERLKGQVNRYKTQMEDMEKREDDLLKEKRSLSREVRRLQSALDDLESENELLKRRIEQMRKKQKD